MSPATLQATEPETPAIVPDPWEIQKASLRGQVRLKMAKRTAELEEKYGVEILPEEYSALSQADRDLANCMECQRIKFRYCDKLDKKKAYWQPTIRIVAGKAIVGKERCPRWNYYLNELCDRAGVPGIYLGRTFADYQKTATNAEAIAMAKWYIKEYPKAPERNGLYFYGGPGTGKTLLASIVARELIAAGHRVLFGDVPHLLKKMKDRFDVEARVTYDDNITAGMIQEKYTSVEVLVLDDIGAGNVTSWSIGVLYEIINDRINAGLRTIVTSNFDLETLSKVLKVKGEEWQVGRIVSRLCGMCEEAYFGINDRRGKKKWE